MGRRSPCPGDPLDWSVTLVSFTHGEPARATYDRAAGGACPGGLPIDGRRRPRAPLDPTVVVAHSSWRTSTVRTLALVSLLLIAGCWLDKTGIAAAQATPDCLGEPITIVASGPGTVTGTAGRDVIVANLDDDAQTIYGLAGNDVICPGTGDTVYAGSGNDVVQAFGSAALYGESGADDMRMSFVGLVDGGSGDGLFSAGGVGIVRGGSGNDVFQMSSVGRCDGSSGTDRFDRFFTDCDSIVSIP
jgi:hypothetical protein